MRRKSGPTTGNNVLATPTPPCKKKVESGMIWSGSGLSTARPTPSDDRHESVGENCTSVQYGYRTHIIRRVVCTGKE